MSKNIKLNFTPDKIAAAEEQIVEQTRKIDFFLTEYSIEMLANKVKKGEMYVPRYQRQFTWEDARKSRFIESLLMGLPIPFLFFWENPKTGKLEIVDGSQRLRTIEEFVLGDLAIDGLESLPKLNGFRFVDLLESRQRKLTNKSVRGIVLSEHADEQSRFDLFERINTGSKNANTAEVRRGALGGPFQSLVIELASLDKFIGLAPFSSKRVRERVREELVTRFFAYGDGLDDYKDSVSAFTFSYTKKMNDEFSKDPNLQGIYRERFVKTIDFIDATFPWGFRKSETGKSTPMSRFEAIAIGSFLALEDAPGLQHQDVSVLDWHDGEELRKVVRSDGANVKSKLLARIDFVRNRLVGVD